MSCFWVELFELCRYRLQKRYGDMYGELREVGLIGVEVSRNVWLSNSSGIAHITMSTKE